MYVRLVVGCTVTAFILAVAAVVVVQKQVSATHEPVPIATTASSSSLLGNNTGTTNYDDTIDTVISSATSKTNTTSVGSSDTNKNTDTSLSAETSKPRINGTALPTAPTTMIAPTVVPTMYSQMPLLPPTTTQRPPPHLRPSMRPSSISIDFDGIDSADAGGTNQQNTGTQVPTQTGTPLSNIQIMDTDDDEDDTIKTKNNGSIQPSASSFSPDSPPSFAPLLTLLLNETNGNDDVIATRPLPVSSSAVVSPSSSPIYSNNKKHNKKESTTDRIQQPRQQRRRQQQQHAVI